MAFVLESEAVAVKYCMQPRPRIDEKECVIDEMFLAEFRKEHLGNRLISRRNKLHVQQSVRFRIDRSVQPELLVIQLDHGHVNCDVIRLGAVTEL
ncbi:hypothetical protein GCM10009020_35370 [Natronoarchaeum mannanilyticum]|uniref:Uncharacterized protein n=1 Tax=Natronoarchaeum mannanilyticum TaxID=926360 RepID=A0AAV3TDS6_9EURY